MATKLYRFNPSVFVLMDGSLPTQRKLAILGKQLSEDFAGPHCNEVTEYKANMTEVHTPINTNSYTNGDLDYPLFDPKTGEEVGTVRNWIRGGLRKKYEAEDEVNKAVQEMSRDRAELMLKALEKKLGLK